MSNTTYMEKLDTLDKIRNFDKVDPDGFVLIHKGPDHKSVIHKSSCTVLKGSALLYEWSDKTDRLYEGYSESQGINLMKERQSIKLCETCTPNFKQLL